MARRPEFLKRGQPVRLQAFLSRSGVASRRAAEEMIAHGRVSVNGDTVTAMGTTVRPGVDRVAVDGEEVKVADITWLALHKPRGYVTSREDPFGRATVYELLPEKYHGLFHVGRLDRDSEGILLLTNDGEMANRLLHPSFGVTKEYDVVAAGKPSDATLRQLVEGVELEDGIARADSAKLLGPAGNGLSRIKLVLREGKKREVRRMLEALGHPVKRLIRRRFGPVSLAELPKGRYRVVAPEELVEGHAARRAEKVEAERPTAPARTARKPVSPDAPPKRAPRGRAAPKAADARKGEARPATDRPAKRTASAPARGGRPRPKPDTPAERPEKRGPARPRPQSEGPASRPSRAGESRATPADAPAERPSKRGPARPPARGGKPGPKRSASPKPDAARPSRSGASRGAPADAPADRPAKRGPARPPARGGKPGPKRSASPKPGPKPGDKPEGRRPAQKRGTTPKRGPRG